MSRHTIPPFSSSSLLLSSSLFLALLLLLTLTFSPTAAQSQPILPPNIPTLTVSGNINFTIPPPLTPDQIYTSISALPYHHSDTANTVRSHLPRFYGPDYFPLTDTSERNQWIRGTIYYVIPGAVMAVLTLAAWILLSIYMCCRTRDYSEPGHDNSRTMLVTSLLLCFAALLAIIFACVGLAYNHYVTDGLTGGASHPSMIVTNTSIVFTSPDVDSSLGVTTAASDILDSLDTFFTAFPILLSNLIRSVNTAVGQVNGNITDASDLVRTVQVLAVEATTTVDSILNVSFAGIGCGSACRNELSPLVDVSTQLNSVLLPVVQVIEYDIHSIDTQLIASQQSITQQINNAITQLIDVNTSITSHKNDAHTVIDDITTYNHDREVATVIFLVLPFICIPLLLLAFLLRSALCFKINMHWMFFVSLICWLLFAVHLAITSAISDACLYADNAEVDLSSHFDTQTTAVLQACLLNTSLLTAVNITDSLSFAFSIDLPDVKTLEQVMNLNELNNLTSTITTDTLLDTIGYNVTAIAMAQQQSFIALNRLTTPDVFTLVNISQCVPSRYGSASNQVSQLQSTILQLQQATRTIPQLASAVQSNVSALVAGVNGVEQDANVIFASFADVAQTIAPVVNSGQRVVESAYCGVLGSEYYAAKHSFCATVQRGVGMIAVSTFLIALFLIPAIVLSLLRAYQQEANELSGKEGVVLSSPGSPQYTAGSVTPPMDSVHVPVTSAPPPPIPSRPPRSSGPSPPGGVGYPLASLPTYTSASYQPQYQTSVAPSAPQYAEQSYRYAGEEETR